MTIVHFVSLWVHIATCLFLTGATFLLLLAGPPSDTVTSRWESRVLLACRWLSGAAVASGVLWFAIRTATFEGRPEAAFEIDALVRSILETWAGQIWMARHGLLILVVFFLLMPCNVTRYTDWFAARSAVFLLSAFVLILAGASGHVAALTTSPWLQRIGMLHLLGSGVWFGALPPLAYLLHYANAGSNTINTYSLRAMRRFSRVAFIAVVIIAGTGATAAWLLLENFAGLIGTTYGRLLVAKIVILVSALFLAAKVRQSLCNPNKIHTSTLSSTIVRRMAYFIVIEAMLVFILLGFAIMMTLSIPAIHSDPSWPLPVRISWDLFENATHSQFWSPIPGVILYVIALLFLLTASRTVHRWRVYGITSSAVCLIMAAISTVSPQLITSAYPTSFVRPQVNYHAHSIAIGKALYEKYCASCSASFIESGTARRLTPGELFWFVTNGFPSEVDLGNFGASLEEIDRWHVVNYLRASIRASQSRTIKPEIDFENPWLVAPDFTISIGPLTSVSLRDYRNRNMVLVVLYNLPESRERLRELAIRYGTLSSIGVEIVAVSRQLLDNPIAKLGDRPAIVFPVMTRGNAEIDSTYGMFVSGTSHSELLIDRQGYIRAIWRNHDIDVSNERAVQVQVEKLRKEKTPPPLPDDHIH
tara:strand:- start:43889 stop:45826 length:1938 start_codon:yes stop_codon:yes gene_type:complete